MNLEEIRNLPDSPGIYKITSPSGKVYIGEAKSLQKRCSSYLYLNKIKSQRKIFSSVKKYGVINHTLEILELCDYSELMKRERFWQEYYDAVENGLNCVYTQDGIRKKEYSQETIDLMSSKSMGSSNPFYGKKHKFETIERISQSSSGKNNPNFGGRFHNEEYLLKQSISNSKKPILIIDTETQSEIFFHNSKEASNFLLCSPSCIREAKKHGYMIKKRYLVKPLA